MSVMQRSNFYLTKVIHKGKCGAVVCSELLEVLLVLVVVARTEVLSSLLNFLNNTQYYLKSNFFQKLAFVLCLVSRH